MAQVTIRDSQIIPRNHQEGLREAPRAKVLRFVREQIAGGEFEPGQPLPAEREMARLLGVSAGTVNTALNELQSSGLLHSNGGKLRYVTAPQRTNSLLRRTFVLIGKPRVHPSHHASGWNDWLDQGVIDSAQRGGMHCLVYCVDNLAQEWEHLLEAEPSGVCVNELIDNEWPALHNLAQAHKGPPLAVFGDEPGMQQYDRVTSDHEVGGYEVTRHLLEAGRRKIALLGPQKHENRYWFNERRAGYEKALREAGIEPLPNISPPQLRSDLIPTREEFNEQVTHLVGHLADPLLGQNVDALVALSDRNIPALAQACQLLRRTPNEDVALAGFDNYWSDCSEREYNDTPPLISLDKRYYECGQQMFKLLQSRIRHELPNEPQKVFVRPELVILPN